MPAATGKLSICTAKMNAATRPASGAVRSSSSRRAPRRQIADAGDGDGAGGDGHGCVDEAVGHVHHPLLPVVTSAFVRRSPPHSLS